LLVEQLRLGTLGLLGGARSLAFGMARGLLLGTEHRRLRRCSAGCRRLLTRSGGVPRRVLRRATAVATIAVVATGRRTAFVLGLVAAGMATFRATIRTAIAAALALAVASTLALTLTSPARATAAAPFSVRRALLSTGFACRPA
jgi:hypothetical protein